MAQRRRDLLRIQVQELLEQLNDVENALGHKKLDERLRERVAVRFQRVVGQHRDATIRLRDGLAGDLETRAGWSALNEVRAKTAPLFAESLALLEGGLVRGIGLDRGLCRIADAMLGQLARLSECPWDRFTVLDQGEYFNGLAEVIRLRFPDLTIWSLPVAAHEFGHHVAGLQMRNVDGTQPFSAVQTQVKSNAHAHEYFADCFATYALGPAYPAACVLQRFDPSSARRATVSHPAAAARVWLCLYVLGRMNRLAGLLSPFAAVIDLLSGAWSGMVEEAAGGAPELAAETERKLEAVGGIYWDLLEFAMPAARYRGWLTASGAVEGLLEAIANRRAREAKPGDVRDILNTAWAARQSGPREAVIPLADWGLRACLASVPDEAAVEGYGA